VFSRLVFALALSLTACGPSQSTYKIMIDYSFTDAERGEIRLAAEEWRIATSGRLNVAVVDQFCDVVYDGQICVKREHSDLGDGVTYRDYGDNKSIIRIDPGLSLAYLHVVALHELGHAFGLQHRTCGVMRPNSREGDRLEPCDVAYFCSYWGGC